MKFSRVLALSGAIILTIGSSILPVFAEISFQDVPRSHPSHTAITYLAEKEIINGYEDGTFKPERTVTRAEITKISLLGAGIDVPASVTETGFEDVPADAWYAPFVATGRELEIISGYEDGTFLPDRTVSRVEGLKILFNTLDVELPPVPRDPYPDIEKGEWYAPYVQYVKDHQLLDVAGDTFDRDNGLRRKDISEILYRLQISQDIVQAPVWKVGPWVLAILVWIGFGAFALRLIHRKFPQPPTYLKLTALLGPLTFATISFMNVSIPNFQEGKKRGLLRNMREHLKLNRPRQLEQELLQWFDHNIKWVILGCIGLFGVVFIVRVILITSESAAYRELFRSIAESLA